MDATTITAPAPLLNAPLAIDQSPKNTSSIAHQVSSDTTMETGIKREASSDSQTNFKLTEPTQPKKNEAHAPTKKSLTKTSYRGVRQRPWGNI